MWHASQDAVECPLACRSAQACECFVCSHSASLPTWQLPHTGVPVVVSE